MKYDLVLVSCCAKKKPGRHPAEHLYESQLFNATVAWAKRNGKAWAIASAEYGIVSPCKIIESYDRELNTLDLQNRFGNLADSWLRSWHSVQGRRFNSLGGEKSVITGHYPYQVERKSIAIMAGAKYASPILEHSARRSSLFSFMQPMQGLEIGNRLKFLKDAKANDQTCQPTLF
tara:strand:- start:258 stop:782 length:525 start_codon:yes stop_codon:yes gene_type:complete